MAKNFAFFTRWRWCDFAKHLFYLPHCSQINLCQSAVTACANTQTHKHHHSSVEKAFLQEWPTIIAAACYASCYHRFLANNEELVEAAVFLAFYFAAIGVRVQEQSKTTIECCSFLEQIG